jgi:GTPase KRas
LHMLKNTRYDPTIEDSYSVTRTIDGTTYSLSLTDTAGQEEYRGLWSSSNLTSDAFLLVYDITQESTLEQLEYFNSLIDMERETRLERGATLPVCIVAGNKCDLQSLRQVGARQGLEWARTRGYGFMETSAREMVNIEETFARKWYSVRKRLRIETDICLQCLYEESSRPAEIVNTESEHPLCPTPQHERNRWIHFHPQTRRTYNPGLSDLLQNLSAFSPS